MATTSRAWGGNKGNWVPLNPQLAEVVTSGLTVMARIPDADAGASVKDYFYFMAQVRGMALQESLGAPALELYVEGTGLRYAMPLDELGVYGPPLEAFRDISRSGLISNVLAVADGTNVHDQGKTIDPVRLREMTMRAALARSSDALAPARGTPPEMRRPQATPSRDRAREPTSLGRRLGAQAAAFLDRPGVRHDVDSRGAMAVGAHVDADDLEQHAAVFPAAAALDQSPRAIEQRGAEHDRRESARDAERARSHLGTAVREGMFQTPSARRDQASDEGEQRTSATSSTPARATAQAAAGEPGPDPVDGVTDDRLVLLEAEAATGGARGSPGVPSVTGWFRGGTMATSVSEVYGYEVSKIKSQPGHDKRRLNSFYVVRGGRGPRIVITQHYALALMSHHGNSSSHLSEHKIWESALSYATACASEVRSEQLRRAAVPAVATAADHHSVPSRGRRSEGAPRHPGAVPTERSAAPHTSAWSVERATAARRSRESARSAAAAIQLESRG